MLCIFFSVILFCEILFCEIIFCEIFFSGICFSEIFSCEIFFCDHSSRGVLRTPLLLWATSLHVRSNGDEKGGASGGEGEGMGSAALCCVVCQCFLVPPPLCLEVMPPALPRIPTCPWVAYPLASQFASHCTQFRIFLSAHTFSA